MPDIRVPCRTPDGSVRLVHSRESYACGNAAKRVARRRRSYASCGTAADSAQREPYERPSCECNGLTRSASALSGRVCHSQSGGPRLVVRRHIALQARPNDLPRDGRYRHPARTLRSRSPGRGPLRWQIEPNGAAGRISRSAWLLPRGGGGECGGERVRSPPVRLLCLLL
ncbi:hypothetical protein GY45DRAFT_139999 [Cubamyces sp. BRFM 1775]|nr:hypothetical protein GY45DRAFT_139999 [Cubamyces sp. BRFM 1775]